MAVDRADIDRRVQAQEMILTELLARASEQDGNLLTHLEQMLSQKGPTHDRDDDGPDSLRYAQGIVAAARRLSEAHKNQ